MLLSLTGGLVYHWRALRYKDSNWSDFRTALHSWLMDWRPPETALLLIGPSGGYCLQSEFLGQFDRLSAVDPDPIAARIFAYRFPASAVRWQTQDYFSPRKKRFEIHRLKTLLAKHPNHAVLFCNFLGQLPLIDPEAARGESFALWKRQLLETLGGRSWASFHDRFSGTLAPHFDLPKVFPDAISDTRVVEDLYSAPHGGGTIELSEHLTGDLFPGFQRSFFRWQLIPGTWHLIEAVRNASSDD